jgi:hypothetical protein
LDTRDGCTVSIVRSFHCFTSTESVLSTSSNRPRHPPHYNQMRHLVSELRAHAHSWPFHEAVNADEVTDYYDVITEPMGNVYHQTATQNKCN